MSRSGPLEGADGGGDPRPGEPFCPGGGPSPGPPEHRPCPGPSLADDTDANSNGSSGNESNGPESRGASQRSSHSSSSGNGKDSALLETTESSKSTNSQSPSPPSSSIAYSLLSASSEPDNPSTSGCSSEQSARARTQKELMTALRELKLRLPPERRGKGRSGTLATLQYALACVKQVQANQEFYQQWSLEEGEPCAMDMSTYTLEELEHVTSEYTLRNQAGVLLRCKRDVFRGARFSELLAPQDVGVFYGSTTPSRLPTWGPGASSGSGLKDFTQEKSVFCRIRGGPDRDPGPRYQPFRLTPYVTKIRVSDGAPAQPCCLLIAERIHSGYEAPRIPPDKRIFTTRHTPSCLFQDVDERAAPLLGYLPQDLLGAPVLLFLHPEDRPLMLAIHKKILQLAGQPFDHSPIRFCARNGEYVTMDTSWAGFVHPWSRKVAFVLGRHKVRTAPLNEDVFTPPAPSPALSLDSDIQELSEQIHRLLLQPVHSPSPTGFCGVGPVPSSGPLLSPGSSSESNGGDAEGPGPPAPVTFQQICKDVHLVKHQGQQLFIESRARPLPRPRVPSTGTFKAKTLPCQSPDLEAAPAPIQAPLALAVEEAERKEASSCSYQQINCLDSILRYLESCNLPGTTKRKCASSSSCTASSASDDDKQRTGPVSVGAKKDASAVLPGEGAAPLKEPVAGGGALSPLALANKAESVVSVTSQCSFSSTIVHVGDKKPPESDIIMMEDVPSLPPGPAPSPAPSPTVAPEPAPDAYRPVGLTKAVLSLHTQKEEQAFLSRFRDFSRLRGLDSSSTAPSAPGERGCHHSPATPGRRHHCRSKAKRSRHHQTARAEAPGYISQPSPVPPSAPWPPPPATPPFPAVVQPYPLPVFPARGGPQPLPPAPTSVPPAAFPAPLVTPMVALVLPNYLFPTPSTYPYGAPQTPAEGPPTPASRSPSPSLPPLPPSPPHHPDSPLFNSRCSSPLQLNLLQLEEPPRGEGGAVAGGSGSSAGPPPSEAEPEARLAEVTESSNQDALSGSSDLLELLLQEDSRSGTGSAASGSLGSGLGSGSGSHEGGSTSASITRSSQSSHTSKYFGSIDSSEAEAGAAQARAEPGDQVIKYVLQDPIWLLMANADQRVMMTYQVPSRPVWTAVAAPKSMAILMTLSSQKWMDWGWSPWRRAEARVVAVVVRVRAAMRPRPKLGPGSRALRTWPWKRKSKVGAHPVQPYLPQKMAPARLHLGPPPGVHEKLPSLMPQNSDVAGPTNKRTAPASPAVGGRGPHHQPRTQGLPLASLGTEGGILQPSPAQRSLPSRPR
ncbi:period circadian protein homolog 1 isoform 2-T4 [Dama dama]|uniref:period circadian protein homolog 1 isoform X2 n=1 Tax=Dama dama TaxID=30532 RepID=UPI002A36BA6E|nr:period circadian protein homolog 1 isoform X2 [Dama dama]